MATKRNSNLRLITNARKDSSDRQTELDHPEVFGPGLLSLFQSRSSGSITTSDVVRLVGLLNKISPSGSLVQLAHDVSIDLKNTLGDGSITFNYEIANYSFKDLESRVHRFWFSHEQKQVEVKAFSKQGQALEVEYLETNPNYIEVRVKFSQFVQSAESFSYRVEFDVSREFVSDSFFTIGTRTTTNKISFSVTSPEGFYFENRKLTRDSSDGLNLESRTLLSLSLEGGRQKLSWQVKTPKSGDQFKTSWCLA